MESGVCSVKITPISPAREAAYRVLLATKSRFAVDLLQRPEVPRLKEEDRRLTTELVMGVLRWRGDLDFEIERLSGRELSYFDPEIAEILRLGVYQIRFLTSIPKSAAVNESVELAKRARKKSAAGLVNAILRKCERAPFAVRHAEELAADQRAIASARRSIPSWILDRWELNFPPHVVRALILGSQQIPRACLRVSGGAEGREEIRRELESCGIRTRLGTYGRRALVVERGQAMTSDAWHDGRVTLQDEASQLVAELVAPRRGDWVLDLCAAPGVKSAQLAEMMRTGTLVACDRSPRRMRTMERIRPKAWLPDVHLHRVFLDARRPLPFAPRFDRVLVDAPCSGTGTLARNPEIKWRLKAEDLPRLADAQRAILAQALAILKPGGRLVYATCSLEAEENEQVVSEVLAAMPEFRLLSVSELAGEFPEMSTLFVPSGRLQTLPWIHEMDGFFAVVIVRNER